MFRIGEFSKITQVSVRMLRYYDEQRLLIPASVDAITGYRMYAVEQIEQLNRVILLRDMGFGVEEIKGLLHNWETKFIKDKLLAQIDKSNKIIKSEELRKTQLQSLIYDLEHQDIKLDMDVVIKKLPMQQVISMRKIVPDYYCEGQMWQEFSECLDNTENYEKISSFSIYHDIDYREKDVDIEICIIPEKYNVTYKGDSIITRQLKQVDVAACFMVYGPYSNISKAYKEFAYWLEQHKEYKLQGENMQICHVAACHTDNPAEYVTELQIPLHVV